MKKSFLIIAVMSLFMISCSKDVKIAEQYHSFEESKWHRFDKLYFDLAIDKIDEEFDVYVEYIVNEAYIYDNLPCHFIMNLPSGEEIIKESKMGFRNKEGEILRGERMEDGKRIKVKVLMWKKLAFTQSGDLKISVENIIPKFDTFGVDSFGIIVERSPKEVTKK
jgi:gliding motility-associated lipoprotein GldH